jgi:quercetin dioxygenase-like cupin family protein
MAGEARVVWMPGGVRTEVHLTGEETAGAFCLLLDSPPVGWSLPAHRHLREAETIHIIEGEFEMEIDGRRSDLSAGQTVHVPKGVIHAGANVGSGPGRRAVLFSPAGLERFFLEAGAPSPEIAFDAAATLALARDHGWEFSAQR